MITIVVISRNTSSEREPDVKVWKNDVHWPSITGLEASLILNNVWTAEVNLMVTRNCLFNLSRFMRKLQFFWELFFQTSKKAVKRAPTQIKCLGVMRDEHSGPFRHQTPWHGRCPCLQQTIWNDKRTEGTGLTCNNSRNGLKCYD